MKHNHNGLDSHSLHNQEEPEHHVGHAAHEEQVEQGMHDDHTHHEHHNHGDGGAHAHHNHGNFKELFLKSLPLGVIVMLLSPMFGFKLPFQFTFPYSNIVVSALSTILIIYGGRPFFQGAVDEFKQKQPDMMALVSLGIGVSYLYSIYAVVATYVTGDHVMDFFFEFSSLLLIMLLGHWIEMKAVREAGDAQRALAALVPKDAHVVLEDESIETRPVSELKVGDIVRVQAGENVPADGILIRGESRVNEALLTGESKPIKKNIGDEVIGGSTNGQGLLYLEVKETGDKSFISQVQKLISEAQSQPSRAENIAHKVASWLFYIAIVIALIAFTFSLFTTNLQLAILFAVTTLVIACPHALGLAIPLVVAHCTTLGATRGLLVKDREALELTTKSDVMILDKTGTLTTGEFKVLNVAVLDNKYTEKDIIALLAGIEGGSSHPIAQSVVKYAAEQNVQATSFDSIDVVSGAGVEGQANGRKYELISQKAYGKSLDIEVTKGATLSILAEEGQAIGTVALGDELKETSKELMRILKKRGTLHLDSFPWQRPEPYKERINPPHRGCIV